MFSWFTKTKTTHPTAANIVGQFPTVSPANQTVNALAPTYPGLTNITSAIKPGQIYSAGTGVGFGSVQFPAPKPVFVLGSKSDDFAMKFFDNTGNKEICILMNDGSVKWPNGINVDAASDAFANSIEVAVSKQAGITEGVSQRLRDSIFEDIISIAKEKGPLSSDDLTFMLQSSKIMEKLKGIK